MPWFRWDAEFTSNPQVIPTDWRGRVYFWQLCSVCKLKQFGGRVPKAYHSGEYIAHHLPGLTAKQMDEGKRQAIKTELAIKDGDDLVIPQWEKWQTDPTAADRMRRYRKRLKSKGSGRRNDTVTDVSVTTDKRLETREEKKDPDGSSSTSSRGDEVRQVFDYWMKVMGKRSNTKLTADRATKIRARLKEGYTVEDICRGIDGCSKSAFHMGDNDDGKMHNDIELICRKGSKLEQFIDMASGPVQQKQRTLIQGEPTKKATQKWQ